MRRQSGYINSQPNQHVHQERSIAPETGKAGAREKSHVRLAKTLLLPPHPRREPALGFEIYPSSARRSPAGGCSSQRCLKSMRHGTPRRRRGRGHMPGWTSRMKTWVGGGERVGRKEDMWETATSPKSSFVSQIEQAPLFHSLRLGWRGSRSKQSRMPEPQPGWQLPPPLGVANDEPQVLVRACYKTGGGEAIKPAR